MTPKLAYDPVKSFAPVAGVARVPNVLVVPAASPARTIRLAATLAFTTHVISVRGSRAAGLQTGSGVALC